MRTIFTEKDLEILISTKDRTNLDFLLLMFPFTSFSNFNILIINQSKNCVLASKYETVRVINSTEVGLSKSRNVATNNATKNICLIADDDVVYFENFDKEIINAFNSLHNPAIVTFNHQRIGLDKPKNQSRIGYKHTIKSILEVCSIEIAFQNFEILKNKIYFDEYFGLGAYFEIAEENLFLRKALKQKVDAYYNPAVIVAHPLLSSGNLEGNDKITFARAAFFYKNKGIYGYFELFKYLFFLLRKGNINKSEFIAKYKVGLSGIKKYKELEENRNTNNK